MPDNPFYFEEDARLERHILRRVIGWVLFILCLVSAGVAVSLHAQEPQIRCVEGYCIIARAEFEAIVRQAQQAEKYAAMCGWAQR